MQKKGAFKKLSSMREDVYSNNYPRKIMNLHIFNKKHVSGGRGRESMHLENINHEKFRILTINPEFHRFLKK